MGLYNDYTDIEHKVKKEMVRHELFASIVIPFNKGSDILARTIASLTKQTYDLLDAPKRLRDHRIMPLSFFGKDRWSLV